MFLEDFFCMEVHDCIVQDGTGGQADIQLLDSDGCAIDKHLLDNIRYSGDLVAGREAHVFKFAGQL